jgi:hypothetical protein
MLTNKRKKINKLDTIGRTFTGSLLGLTAANTIKPSLPIILVGGGLGAIGGYGADQILKEKEKNNSAYRKMKRSGDRYYKKLGLYSYKPMLLAEFCFK